MTDKTIVNFSFDVEGKMEIPEVGLSEEEAEESLRREVEKEWQPGEDYDGAATEVDISVNVEYGEDECTEE